MKKKYKAPEISVREFTLKEDTLAVSDEENFGGDDNTYVEDISSDRLYKINSSGFGW